MADSPTATALGSSGAEAAADRRCYLVGGGKYAGDGGRELQRVWWACRWKAIPRCDGRFVSRDRSLARLALAALCERLSVDASPVVIVRGLHGATDIVTAVRFRGGGGLLTYSRGDGVHVHTLNTESGLARKLLALGCERRLAHALPQGPALLFSSLCRLLAALPA